MACSSGGSPPDGPLDAAPPTATVSVTGASASPEPEPATSEPMGEITNLPPDGGVVMNNAQPAADGGPSDRLKPILDLITQHRDKYRACFDKWGKGNPGKEVKVTLSLVLKPSGELVQAAFKADETDVSDKAMETCMADVSKALTFPASPSSKETTYNHRFVFKAKK